MTTKSIMSVAELNKAIDAVNGSAQKVQAEYQKVGVMTLERLLAHGDVGPVNRLFIGMPKSTRRLAMGSWLLAYGAIVLNDDAGTKDTMAFKFSKDKKTDPVGAAEDMWYDHAPEKKIDDTFDLQVAIRSLLHRAKGKTLLIGGEEKAEAAAALLKAMAAGAGVAYEGNRETDTKANGEKPAADAADTGAHNVIPAEGERRHMVMTKAVKAAAKPAKDKATA